jgi:hypothetical protein
MKKVLLGIVIGAFAFHAHQRVNNPAPGPAYEASAEAAPDNQLVEPPATQARAATASFRCDGRVHCSEMSSCEEADFFVQNCAGVKMDGDRDGKPCEDRCGH